MARFELWDKVANRFNFWWQQHCWLVVALWLRPTQPQWGLGTSIIVLGAWCVSHISECGTYAEQMILSKQHFSSLLLIHMWNFNLRTITLITFASSYVTYLVVYFTTKSLQLDGSHYWSLFLEVYYLPVYTTTVHTELETGTSRPLKTPKKKQYVQ